MKILVVHNSYGKLSGEEAVVVGQKKLLADNGHEVICFERSSAEIPLMRLGKLRALFSGIYSFASRRQIRRLLAQHKPDIVHIHNLFPLISPAILPECKRAGVSVVMTVHNYRLVCPNGLHMTAGRVCEKCCGGREYQCLLNNCESNLFKSLGYFLRNYVARKFKLFKNNVSIYACLTEFQRDKLIAEGFAPDKVAVIPNMVDGSGIKPAEQTGEYIGFVGRVSPEKGVDTLVEAAKKLTDIQFKAAGAYDRMQALVTDSPENLGFKGHLNKDKLSEFYSKCRFIVFPSMCYETFGLPIVEVALRGRPVIASRIGVLPEIVDDGVTGLLFEPGNADDLAKKIRYLWDNPGLCRKMGQAGRGKALREYSPEKYYERLMAVYKKTIELGPGGPSHHGLT